MSSSVYVCFIFTTILSLSLSWLNLSFTSHSSTSHFTPHCFISVPSSPFIPQTFTDTNLAVSHVTALLHLSTSHHTWQHRTSQLMHTHLAREPDRLPLSPLVHHLRYLQTWPSLPPWRSSCSSHLNLSTVSHISQFFTRHAHTLTYTHTYCLTQFFTRHACTHTYAHTASHLTVLRMHAMHTLMYTLLILSGDCG